MCWRLLGQLARTERMLSLDDKSFATDRSHSDAKWNTYASRLVIVVQFLPPLLCTIIERNLNQAIVTHNLLQLSQAQLQLVNASKRLTYQIVILTH